MDTRKKFSERFGFVKLDGNKLEVHADCPWALGLFLFIEMMAMDRMDDAYGECTEKELEEATNVNSLEELLYPDFFINEESNE